MQTFNFETPKWNLIRLSHNFAIKLLKNQLIM